VKPNNLINEKSPYLLQHAYNPVNWYPWNEEAFEKAKKEDKPIFLPNESELDQLISNARDKMSIYLVPKGNCDILTI